MALTVLFNHKILIRTYVYVLIPRFRRIRNCKTQIFEYLNWAFDISHVISDIVSLSSLKRTTYFIQWYNCAMNLDATPFTTCSIHYTSTWCTVYLWNWHSISVWQFKLKVWSVFSKMLALQQLSMLIQLQRRNRTKPS